MDQPELVALALGARDMRTGPHQGHGQPLHRTMNRGLWHGSPVGRRTHLTDRLRLTEHCTMNKLDSMYSGRDALRARRRAGRRAGTRARRTEFRDLGGSTLWAHRSGTRWAICPVTRPALRWSPGCAASWRRSRAGTPAQGGPRSADSRRMPSPTGRARCDSASWRSPPWARKHAPVPPRRWPCGTSAVSTGSLVIRRMPSARAWRARTGGGDTAASFARESPMTNSKS